MTFLNSLLLIGAAAFLVPLIIHILNRSRFKTVEWGAMHLLESVIKVNHRRFQIEQIILLIIRCLIPILLAFCLARPVLTGKTGLAGDAPVSLVIVLDTSYSMDAIDTTGTRFEHAVEAATQIIEATGRGSEISVIMTGGKPTPLFDQPVFDGVAVTQRLKQQQAGLGASDVQGGLEAALTTLAAMTQARRELVVISDFQEADWRELMQESSLSQQIAALPVQPVLTLLPIGRSIADNVAVESLEIPSRALGVEQRVDVRATLRNHGPVAIDQARVTLQIDGGESDVSQVSLAANSSTQVLFPCTFETAGSHTVEVRVNANDSLKTDNSYAASVTIWDQIQVLLVDGDPRNKPLESETDFLSIALSPFTFGRVRLADLVETKTIKSNELNEDVLKSSRIVVLANVPRLDDAQLAALTAYVEQGGALFVCGGDRIDLIWSQEKMFAGGKGLLPVTFGTMQGQVDDTGKASRIVAEHFDHPALEFFNTAANGDLSQAEIRRWLKLEVPSDRDDVVVLARLETGDPLLVERNFGEGVVLQMATACDADWSDLPLRPFYVPLMQQLVTSLASGLVPPRNISTGEPAVALLSGVETESTLAVLLPNGARQTLQTVTQGNSQLARFDRTQRPGIYAITLPSTETLYFAAETSRDESNLNSLQPEAIKSLAEKLGASVAESSTQYIEADHLRRHGREIWQLALMGFLGLLFLEVVLQQRFARVHV